MRRLDATSYARAALTAEQSVDIWDRAKRDGVYVIAGRNVRQDCWRVVVERGPQSVVLEGSGDLYAVITGAMDDFAEQDYTPDELAQIRKQSAA